MRSHVHEQTDGRTGVYSMLLTGTYITISRMCWAPTGHELTSLLELSAEADAKRSESNLADLSCFSLSRSFPDTKTWENDLFVINKNSCALKNFNE